MAVIAREPVALVPSNGIRDDDSSPPPTQTPSLDCPTSTTSDLAKEDPKFFLHIVGDNGIDQPPGLTDRVHADNDDAIAPALSIPAETKVFGLAGTKTVSGMIMTGTVFATATQVSEVSFEGMSFAVPQARAIQVPGNFGTLTIRADGTFFYARAANGFDFVDAFACIASGGEKRIHITLRIVSGQEGHLPQTGTG